jgi:hypothetical protein
MDREQLDTGVHNIVSMSKDTGQPVVLFSDETMARLLTIDETHIYWITKDGQTMRMPKTGGTPELAPLQSNYGAVFDGADAYWSNSDGDLIRSAKDGSAAITLVKASDFASYKVGERLIQRGLGRVIPGAADSLYFTAFSDGNVGMVSCTDNHTMLMKIAKSGGEYRQIGEMAGSANILIREPYAYFGGACIEGFRRLNLDTQTVEDFVRAGQISSLTADDNYVYWIELESSGSIYRAPMR